MLTTIALILLENNPCLRFKKEISCLTIVNTSHEKCASDIILGKYRFKKLKYVTASSTTGTSKK